MLGKVATSQGLLQRIAIGPALVVRIPVIRGAHLALDSGLKHLAQRTTLDAIPAEYDGLIKEDIRADLLSTTRSLESTDFLLRWALRLTLASAQPSHIGSARRDRRYSPLRTSGRRHRQGFWPAGASSMTRAQGRRSSWA